jgi:hypothetical protein
MICDVMKRSDYFICFVGELPVKVTYEGSEVQVLTYEFETGDFVPNVVSWTTIYMSQDPVEQVTELEFEGYVAKLRELCHLQEPRYYIISKLPVKAIPVDDRFPDVRKFNLETDAFDIVLSYFHLVKCRLGELGRVEEDAFEHYVQEIRVWRDHLQAPKYYIVSGQPVKIVRADDGKLRLLGYRATDDSFIPSEWKWRSLIPPINPDWVSEVSENRFQQQVEVERAKSLKWSQRENEA